MKVPTLLSLEAEYSRMFAECRLSVDHIPEDVLDEKQRAQRLEMLRDEIGWSCKRIAENQARYEAVAMQFTNGIPWFGIAAIHAMEGGLNFSTHLANGDSLKARTVNVPRGLPRTGSPPFSWEDGARAAILEDKLDKVTRWDLAGLLYVLEGFNGWGTRVYHKVPTPYLWSGTPFYVEGKYVADGEWNPTAMSKQLGAALLLRELVNRRIIAFRGEAVV